MIKIANILERLFGNPGDAFKLNQDPNLRLPTKPNVFAGWGDFISEHSSRFFKMPDAFLTDVITGSSNYDLRLFDAIQDEMYDRTGKLVSTDVIRSLERTAMGHTDYIAKLSYQLYVLEQHIKRGNEQVLVTLSGYTYQLPH